MNNKKSIRIVRASIVITLWLILWIDINYQVHTHWEDKIAHFLLFRRLKGFTAQGLLSLEVNKINRMYEIEIRQEVGKRKAMAVGVRGVAGAVFPALKKLNSFDIISIGVTGTEKIGRSGALQESLKEQFGHIIGMAKLVPVLQSALPRDTAELRKKILNHTITREDLDNYTTLREIILDKIRQEGLDKYPGLSVFLSDILNAVRIIDEYFVNNSTIPDFNIENKPFGYLLDIAVRYKMEAIKVGLSPSSRQNRIATWVLEKIYGTENGFHLLVPSYEEATPYVVYNRGDIRTNAELQRLLKNGEALIDKKENTVTIFGDRNFISFRHNSKAIDAGLAKRDDKWRKDREELFLNADEKFIQEVEDSDMFVSGVDLFFASILPVFATPGVIDALIKKRLTDPDFISTYIFEHVNMIETNNLSIMDRIRIIENIADRVISPETRQLLGGRKIKFGDIFNNVIVNHTLAKEINMYLSEHNLDEFGKEEGSLYNERAIDKIDNVKVYVIATDAGKFLGGIDKQGNKYGIYIDSKGNYMGKGYIEDGEFIFYSKGGNKLREIPEGAFLLNKYTYFLLKHPEMKKKWQLRDQEWRDEWKYLSGLSTPPFLFSESTNSERGRYYDAVYITRREIDYLKAQGVRVYVKPILGEITKVFYIQGVPCKEKFIGISPAKLEKVLEEIVSKKL